MKSQNRAFKTSITKDEVNQLPLRSFEGKIEVITQPNSLEKIFKEIDAFSVVGIDTETRPSFVKGKSNHVSLLQIAIPGKVFLIRINKTSLTAPIIKFLESKTLKVGVALRDDIIALQKLIPFNTGNFCDLNNLAPAIGLEAKGLRKLTAITKGFRISKRQQTSNWEKQNLDAAQIKYAATDAWCCLEIIKEIELRGYIKNYSTTSTPLQKAT